MSTATTPDDADKEAARGPYDMLERAWRLLRTVDVGGGDGIAGKQTKTWRDALERWQADYHRLMDDTRPRAAIIDILERGADLDALDNPPAPLVPNEIRIQGIPLWVTEDGPVIHEIKTGDGTGRGLVQVTMTLIARRVTIDAAPAR